MNLGSPALRLASEDAGIAVGVDIGGTKVLAGVVDEDGTVRRTVRHSTPGRRVDVAMVEDTLTAAVVEVAEAEPVLAVGLAAAGLVDAAGESVRFAPHLPWRGEDVRHRLAQRWGVPVLLDNDANAAAWAEASYGAGRGARALLMVTLGTGIGGALVLGGALHRGTNGMAGEFGHMQVVPGGRECQCGGSGCWEQYSSGNALVRHAFERMAEPTGLLGEACQGDRRRLTGPMITAAATAGDPLALGAFAEIGDWLGVGMANLVAAVDPERLVVGGGLADADELLLAPARAALARSLVGAEHRTLPTVVRADLGPLAGLVGAAALARAHARAESRVTA